MGMDTIDHFKSLFICTDFKSNQLSCLSIDLVGKCSWSVTWEQSDAFTIEPSSLDC